VTILSPERERRHTADTEVLIPEARQHRRRRYRKSATILLVATVTGGLVVTLGSVGGTNPPLHTTKGYLHDLSIGRPLPLSVASASTAYAISGDGLVPIQLASGSIGSPILVPGIVNAVVARSGAMAYALTVATSAPRNVTYSGVATYDLHVAIVPVNLQDHRAGPPIALNTGELLRTNDTVDNPPSAGFPDLAITPDGKIVLVADATSNSLIAVDVRTRRVEPPVRLPAERSAISYILVRRRPGVVVNLRAGTITTTLPPLQVSPKLAPITAIAVNPNGRTAYVVDGTAVVPFDIGKGIAGRPIGGLDDPLAIAISPDGTTAYVTNPGCWSSVKTGLCVKNPVKPLFEPNGRIQFYEGGDHVSVINLRNDTLEKNIDLGRDAQPTGIATSPDGSRVYVTHGEYASVGNEVTVIDTSTASVVSGLTYQLSNAQQGEGAFGIAVTPNGMTAYVDRYVGAPATFDTFGDMKTVYQGLVGIDLAASRHQDLLPLPGSIAPQPGSNNSIEVTFAFQGNTVVGE
jgi:DNA-binding beta-propeller fold protein YncE